MFFKLNAGILQSIENAVEGCRSRNDVLDIYRTANHVQKSHWNDNVAIEDIVAALLSRAGVHVPVGFIPLDD